MMRVVAMAGAESASVMLQGVTPREPSSSHGVIEIVGPMVSGDDCWWGGVSTRRVQAAIENAAALGVDVVLDFDSPGGDVSGIAELYGAIIAARQKIDVRAYVRGMCCSAAYWVASACSAIEASPTAVIGQIGVQLVIYDPPVGPDRDGGLRVVVTSAGSDRKNARAGEDLEQYQRLADAAGDEFWSAVARGRGVDEQVVRDTYGRGAVLPAGDALALGMIDAVVGTAKGDSMAGLKAEDAPMPEGPATLEDALKLIEELRRQLDGKAPAEAPAAESMEESSVDAPIDPEKEELRARLAILERESADAKMAAAVQSLIDTGRLETARRAKAERAYKLAADAKAGRVDRAYATAWDEFVAELPASRFVRVSAVAPPPVDDVPREERIAIRAKALMAEGKPLNAAIHAATQEVDKR